MSLERKLSPSPLAELYDSPGFLLEWDNDLPYHLSQHVVRLRRYRELSQSQLADKMGTSQAKVARIEGGEENVTLRTVTKLAVALSGRLTLALQPAEMQMPKLPQWWEYPPEAAATLGGAVPVLTKWIAVQRATGASIGAQWDAFRPGVTSGVGSVELAAVPSFTFDVQTIAAEPPRRFLPAPIAKDLDKSA